MREIESYITGRVQGVMFRDFTERAARRLGIYGEVENLPDGSVHVIAQGTEEDLNEFLSVLRKGPTFARVDNVSVEWRKPQQGYDTFSISYHY